MFIAILIALIILLLAGWVLVKFFLTRVSGESMLPTYKEGDVLLVRPIFSHKIEKPEKGKTYLYVWQRQVVKRLTETLPNVNTENLLCFFEGDNPDKSYDSRHYGPIRWAKVRFKVIKKLFNYNGEEGRMENDG